MLKISRSLFDYSGSTYALYRKVLNACQASRVTDRFKVHGLLFLKKELFTRIHPIFASILI